MGNVVYTFQKRLQRKRGEDETRPEMQKLEWSVRSLNNDMAKAERRVARFIRLHRQQTSHLQRQVEELDRLKRRLAELEQGEHRARSRLNPRFWWMLAGLMLTAGLLWLIL